MKLIEKKELNEEYERYDLSVENTHNFVAEGAVVHNSNFSLYTNGSHIRYARREAFLEEGENFFNFRKIQSKMDEFMRKIYEMLAFAGNGVYTPQSITVYGELYGGNYPHPDVKRIDGVSQVQKKIYYNPDICYMPFDIVIDDIILSTTAAQKIFSDVGIFEYARNLFSGTLDQCLKFPNEFQTTIPALYGLPEINGNICEGVVIRPDETLYFSDGARIMTKNKNAKFKEDENNEPMKEKPKPTGAEKEYIDLVNSYINDNRIEGLISKIGEVTIKDFQKVHKGLVEDVIESLKKDGVEINGKVLGKVTAEATKNYLMRVERGEI